MNALSSARETVPGIAGLMERLTGLAAGRPLPRLAANPFRSENLKHAIREIPPPPRGEGTGLGGVASVGASAPPNPAPDGTTLPARGRESGGSLPASQLPYAVFVAGGGARAEGPGTSREVALLADTFNTYFEPDNLHAAVEVLERLGYRVTVARAADGSSRPLCCGRTFLAAGLVDEAKFEARRTLAALAPLVARGVPVVGLEPSCLLTLRDEWLAMGLGEPAHRLSKQAFLLEEFLAREIDAGRIQGPIGRAEGTLRLHGHCHQKSFGVVPDIQKVLASVEGLTVDVIESSCCGMAGAFGYGAETYESSIAMGELALLPAVRATPPTTRIAADGFSCRHQIADGAGREAAHVAVILRDAMRGAS